MGTEIERKFLVDTTRWQPPEQGGVRLRQGYLARVGGVTVRVRCSDDAAWLCVKGPTSNISRQEFEYPIPVADGEALLALCADSIVEKTRYDCIVADTLFVVDVFAGDNAGLVVAEVELPDEEAPFPRPDWLKREVSLDGRFRNSNLAGNPYRDWQRD